MNRDVRAFLILFSVAVAMSCGAFAGLAYGAEDLECKGATHCLLMSMPSHHTDKGETGAQKWERTKDIAQAIDAATNKRTERAWLLMTGWYESRFAGYVWRDDPKCRDGKSGKCDGGRAWQVWQIWNTDREGGAKAAARKSLELFRKCSNYCARRGHDPFVGGTSMYAKGGTCEWSEAEKRVNKMWTLHWRLGQ